MTTTDRVQVDWRHVPLVVCALAGGVGIAWLLHRGMDEATIRLLAGWRGPLWLTLRISTMATLGAGVSGIAIGYLLAKVAFPGRDLLEAVLSVPMILPPTALGYYVVTTLSSEKPLGRIATSLLGQTPVHNVSGCVLVAGITAFPFVMRNARSAITGVDPRAEQMGRAMGLPGWRVALQVTLPLAWRGILVGLTLGHLRALGEYGATWMVGGGSIQTLSIAVVGAASPADFHANLRVALVLALLALGFLAYLRRRPE